MDEADKDVRRQEGRQCTLFFADMSYLILAGQTCARQAACWYICYVLVLGGEPGGEG